MIDEESHIHDITTCVWNFVDEIAADKVADEILKVRIPDHGRPVIPA